jgi:hypothetical protein
MLFINFSYLSKKEKEKVLCEACRVSTCGLVSFKRGIQWNLAYVG